MRKESLLTLGLVVLFVVTIICSHFNIGLTSTPAIGTGLPTNGWEAITNSISWLTSFLTFNVTTSFILISYFIWIFIVCTIFIPIALIIRGD